MSSDNRGRGALEADTNQDQRTVEARHYVQQLRTFYVHASLEAAAVAIIFLVNLAINMAAGITGEWWAWWSVWALLGCSLAVAVHGLVVRMARPRSHDSAWEQRQIDKILSPRSAEPAR